MRDDAKQRLIRQIFRVLTRGGRTAVSDIVADEPVPPALKDDPELWSGCISGVFHEADLLRELEDAGFHTIRIAEKQREPFAEIGGIAFRSVTVTAGKGQPEPSQSPAGRTLRPPGAAAAADRSVPESLQSWLRKKPGQSDRPGPATRVC